jgi:DnaK suppressor protein
MATRKGAKKIARKTAKKKVVAKKTAKKKVVAKKTAKKKVVAKKTAKKKVVAKKTAKKKVVAKKTAKKKTKGLQKTKKLGPRDRKIQKIRQKLLDQKNALLQEAEYAMNALPEQTVFPDLGDQASAETDRSFMLRLKGREQRLLNKIEEAIERIDEGNYGICESCGESIRTPRLEARPVTTLCIECKTEQEEEEKLLAT